MGSQTSVMPNAPGGGASLDSPPRQPPGKAGKTMMDAPDQGGGNVPQTPLVAAMTGFQMIRQGAAMVSDALPAIAPALSDMVQRLQDVIPQAAAQSSGMLPTGPPGVAAAAGPPPPGIAPPGGGQPPPPPQM